MAQWWARTDQTEPALAAARKAVQLAPEDAGTHLTLAELLRAQKRYGEAEAELERVITLNPSAEEPYLTLARYYVEQKSYERARTVLLRLAERQPKLAQAQFLVGRLAVETENWDEAITRLTKAVELDPDHDGAWTALGYVYETRHQPEDARSEEHTSELQSLTNLVCRLLLEKKKNRERGTHEDMMQIDGLYRKL